MGAPESPAARTVVAQLNAPRFQCGVEEGRWCVLALEFPHLYVSVSATDRESGATAAAEFHLLCDGYPSPGPYVERWDFERKQKSAPPSRGSPGYVDALKEWGGGTDSGIYRAWQRGAANHNAWAQKRPDQAWHAGRDLTFIMERLYDLVLEQARWLGRRKSA